MEWEHICSLGQELDPLNPLYRSGNGPVGARSAPATTAAVTAGVAAASAASGSVAQATPVHAPSPAAIDLDLDFDLDLSLDEKALSTPQSSQQTAASAGDGVPAAGRDLPASDAKNSAYAEYSPDLSLSMVSDPIARSAAAPAPAAAADSGMLEFDLSSLTLDLDKSSSPSPGATDVPPSTAGALLATGGAPLTASNFDEADDDSLVTKLALAEEFSAIGDPDGARSLAEEVRAEASGELKGRAERFLAELS